MSVPALPESVRRVVLAGLLLLAAEGPVRAQDDSFRLLGHIKWQVLYGTYPEDSFFREEIGSTSLDSNADIRLNLAFDRNGWDLRAAYQLIGLYGDTVELTQELPVELQLLLGRFPEDDLRLFDLTRVLTDDARFVALQRLDRLSVGYTTEKGVVRFGRQAITWGNGLIYNPMDIFNPFDPAAVDKEYKTGDDMLYGQYLWQNADDLQGVMVFRRDPLTGDVESDDSSLAFKYHGLVGPGEYDALAARHFGETLLGFGGNVSLGGAVWSGDLVLTWTDDDRIASAVTGLTYSWIWGGKNISGGFEYFYNGFGQPAGEYDPASLAENPELLRRIARGELFTLGRHYLATSVLIEIGPRFLLTPNLFVNLEDPSGLLQVVTETDLVQDLILLGALNVPVGADGTEFGGIPIEIDGLFLSSGPGIFLQLAWYF